MKQGHVPDAVLLNEDRWDELFENFLDSWQPQSNVVVYCSRLECDSSKAVASRLIEDMGIDRIYVLKGGWEAWEQTYKK